MPLPKFLLPSPNSSTTHTLAYLLKIAENVDNVKNQCPKTVVKTNQPMSNQSLTHLTPIDFYVPETSQRAPQEFSVALFEANSTGTQTHDEHMIIAALAASAIRSIFPPVAEPFRDAITEFGVNLVNAHILKKYSAEDLEHIGAKPYSEICLRMGELFILTFKNVHEIDYYSYICCQVQAMGAKVHASVDEIHENPLALDLDQAIVFHKIFEGSASIKKATINRTMFLAKNGKNGPWGSIRDFVSM